MNPELPENPVLRVSVALSRRDHSNVVATERRYPTTLPETLGREHPEAIDRSLRAAIRLDDPALNRAADRAVAIEMKGSPCTIDAMDSNDRLLTVQELAEYLGVPVATLYQWRYRNDGPRGFRAGRHVRYRWSDVEAWIERQLEDVRV